MKNWSLYLIVVLSLLLQSCAEKNPGSANLEQFAGEWEIMIKKLPRVGDQLLSATFAIKDTVLIGSFIDSENVNVLIDEIEIEGNQMKCSYNWDGHDVNFKVEMEANKPDSLQGRFMRLFKVEGVRK